jgi:flagellar hook-length control protein FliK
MGVIGSGGKNTVSGQHKEGTNAQAEPPASSAGQPAIVAPRPSFETQTREVADAGTTQDPVRNVGEQILDSVRASVTHGDKQVSIRLEPPELGTVTVRLREQGEHLEGTLEVGRSDTRRQIEQALPDVVRGLQDAGVPIRRFDVTSSDSPGQDPGRGLPQQDAWSGQHGSGQNHDHAPASQASWSRGADEYPADSHETSSSDRQINPPRGRIDVLL